MDAAAGPAGRRPHHDRPRQGAAGAGHGHPARDDSGIRHDGLLDVWLLDEGDDAEVRGAARSSASSTSAARASRVEPAVRAVPGPDQARQPQRWRSTARARVRRRRADGPRPRAVPELPRADPRLLPRPRRRVRGRARRSTATCAESWVARGAAQLAYLFHGIIQRGGNGHDAPLLIGTNHLYRPTAFAQIGGYQDCIIEDHLTSMAIYTAVNDGHRAATGRASTRRTSWPSAKGRRPTPTSSASRSAGPTGSGRSPGSTRHPLPAICSPASSGCRSSRCRATTRRRRSHGSAVSC